jgi:hypothetical protein
MHSPTAHASLPMPLLLRLLLRLLHRLAGMQAKTRQARALISQYWMLYLVMRFSLGKRPEQFESPAISFSPYLQQLATALEKLSNRATAEHCKKDQVVLCI